MSWMRMCTNMKNVCTRTLWLDCHVTTSNSVLTVTQNNTEYSFSNRTSESNRSQPMSEAYYLSICNTFDAVLSFRPPPYWNNVSHVTIKLQFHLIGRFTANYTLTKPPILELSCNICSKNIFLNQISFLAFARIRRLCSVSMTTTTSAVMVADPKIVQSSSRNEIRKENVGLKDSRQVSL